jgi:arylsulfatase A-like enzyme
VCTPTRAALMTGRYQQRVLLERPLSSSGASAETGLRPTGRSLPQLLKNAGYATALLGKWHLGMRPEFRPRSHGFDQFWGFLTGYVDWYQHVAGNGEADLWDNETPTRHDGYLHHEVTERAIRFIDEHAAAPFFVEVAYGAPHWPWQSPRRPSTADRRGDSMFQRPSDAGAPARHAYVEIMEDFDTEIGRLLDAVAARGLERQTLVVFVSDNGGEWLSRNDPFFSRKDTVWEGGIRVPALLRWPGVLPAGVSSPQVGITMDLTATLLAAAGVSPQPDWRLEGRDLLPILAGREGTAERTLYWRVVRPDARQKAVRRGNLKYVQDAGLEYLFDVHVDPAERVDLASRQPDRLRSLRALVEAWEADVDAEARLAVERQ